MMDFEESKRIDFNYLEKHDDLFPLMRNAGKAVYESIKDFYGGGKNVLFVCGRGNNGGDGLIAASLLSYENRVRILLFTSAEGQVSEMASLAIREMKNASIIKNPSKEAIKNELSWSEVIVDALLGTGIKGKMREPYASLIQEINKTGKPVISVDIPSGLGSDITIKPKITVTFTDLKEGMNESNSGEIVLKDIGIEKSLIENAGMGEMVFFPSYSPDTHKGLNGRLLIIAGWEHHGAGIMSSQASLMGLPDLVEILVPEDKYPIFAGRLTDQMVSQYSEENMRKLLGKSSAVLAGPGLGKSYDAVKALEIIGKSGKPAVLDADAIRLTGEGVIPVMNGAIYTPHSEEFKVLTGMEAGRENAVKFASENNCIILLKGRVDIITDGKRTIYSSGGTPRMATGGTGDVLAGLVAGLLARGLKPFRAAVLASLVNKKTAESIEKFSGYWWNTTDLIENLGQTMKEYYKLVNRKG
ncbi:MAG: NAD(P)H-hydrate dehydratase [Candidatus Thermoplasmatota archaeon]|jgi:NAD(P)H-hydrate epimerase|nr:NAD(P)H-hydrate dehydratase [Candidatus Thermoplasmatota archaeon]MCL5791070.1 NAD(P)H-hydrate dehydratase [Candidatus Thermoplasmatota archaeon]